MEENKKGPHEEAKLMLDMTDTQKFLLKFVASNINGVKDERVELLKECEVPAVVKNIINELKKVEGLTYAEAYGILQVTKMILTLESQYLEVPTNPTIGWKEPEKNQTPKQQ